MSCKENAKPNAKRLSGCTKFPKENGENRINSGENVKIERQNVNVTSMKTWNFTLFMNSLVTKTVQNRNEQRCAC